MSNQGNNNSGGFLQRFEGWIKIGAAVIGFLSALIGFIKLAQGDVGLVTQVSIAFCIATLLLLCGYIYFYWKPNKILQRVALVGMFAIPILTIASFYELQNLPTKDIIVMLTDFEGSSEQKNYRVTQNIFEQMKEATRKYSDVKIQRLNNVIIANFNQGLQLDPKSADAYNNRGVVYSDKKDYDRAIADYNQALQLDPKYAIAYYNRGNAYKNKGRKDKAQEDFKKVLELNDNVELSQKAKQELQKLGTATTVQPNR